MAKVCTAFAELCEHLFGLGGSESLLQPTACTLNHCGTDFIIPRGQVLGLSWTTPGKVMVQFPGLLSSPGTFPVGCCQDTCPHTRVAQHPL